MIPSIDDIMKFMRNANFENFRTLLPHQKAVLKKWVPKVDETPRHPLYPKSGGKITTGSADRSTGKGCDLIIIDDPFNQDPPTEEQKETLRKMYSDLSKGKE